MPSARHDLSALPRLLFVPASSPGMAAGDLYRSRECSVGTKLDHRDMPTSTGSPQRRWRNRSDCMTERSTGGGADVRGSKDGNSLSPAESPFVVDPPSPEALSFPFIGKHGPGLNNVGNSCYANATLQALLYNPPILYVVLHHSATCHSRGLPRSFCALCALRELAVRMHGISPSSSGGNVTQAHLRAASITPSMFTDPANLRQISRTFRHFRQEDAHEFLRGLLDSAIRSALLGCGTPMPASGALPLSREQEMKSVVHAACGGILQSGVRCYSCGYESVTLEPFLDLSIGTATTIERALATFTAADRLDGQNMYKCESCSRKVVASKRMTIRTAPNSLCIHLKRFDGYRKDRSDVKYGARLDLAPYMVSPPPKSALWYNLVAVLVHDGAGTRSGHYYSYVKGSNGTWCMKNDSLSSIVPESRVLRQQAYILFFSRDPATLKHSRPARPPQVSQGKAVSSPNPAKSIVDRDARKKGLSAKEMVPKSAIGPDGPVSYLKSNCYPSPSALRAQQVTDPADSTSSGGEDSATDPDSSGQEVEDDDAVRGKQRHLQGFVSDNRVRRKDFSSSSLNERHSSLDDFKTPPSSVSAEAKDSTGSRRLIATSPENGHVQGALARFEKSRDEPSAPGRSRQTSQVECPSPPSRNPSSIRSTPSGASLCNESVSSRDKSVRAFIAGSGRAVRKFAQRIFNYVGSSPEPKTVSDERASPTSTALDSVVHGVMDGAADSANDANFTRFSLETDSARASTAHDDRTNSNVNVATRGQPKSGPSTLIASRQTVKQTLAKKNVSKKGSFPFSDQGVGSWESVAQSPGADDVRRRPNRILPKRARARDALDAEYDRGKPKKVKRSRNSSGTLRDNVAKVNPFQTAADRRKTVNR